MQFGQFHTESNIFSSLGKIIEGSGGPYLLAEANVVATGSMKLFLKGKMYNRCRRSHLPLSSDFHRLHFKRFLEFVNIGSNILCQLEEWNNLDDEEHTIHLIDLANKYQRYTSDTLSGNFGKTAQFWMT